MGFQLLPLYEDCHSLERQQGEVVFDEAAPTVLRAMDEARRQRPARSRISLLSWSRSTAPFRWGEYARARRRSHLEALIHKTMAEQQVLPTQAYERLTDRPIHS